MSAAENRLRQLCNEIAHEGNLLLAQDQLTHAKKYVEEAQQAFYGSYDPILYDRNGNIGSFAHPEIQGDQFVFNLGPEYGSGSHNASNATIYFWMFKQGYHGGAPSGVRYHPVGRGAFVAMPHPSPGTPYWGTPHPYYTMWGSPAPRSTPPYEIIKGKWNSYIKGEYETKKQAVINTLVSKYGSQVNSILDELEESDE